MQAARFEVHESLSRATKTVPKSLRTLLVVHSRGETLQPVAVVRTHRRVHLLLDNQGRTLAEFCDDHVSADTLEGTEPLTWREWELELVEGDAALLASARRWSQVGRPAVRRDQAGQGSRRAGAHQARAGAAEPTREPPPRRCCRPCSSSRSP